MMKNVMRGMALMMVPITYQMPCAVFCYWSTANAFSLSQTLFLKVTLTEASPMCFLFLA